MEYKGNALWEKKPAFENPYFVAQADWGMTKHMGGLKATDKLIELCRIVPEKHVLVIGCGVGVTSCYLVRKYDCRVTGIDLSPGMVERSQSRAKRQGAAGRTEFRVADAQNLPFEDAVFDAVIVESVNAFIDDKPQAMREYRRVVKTEDI
jgi:ubiquinone/menaquinone biosynthesis C-methylase UbiE